MSRMMFSLMLFTGVLQTGYCTDVDKYPPGHKPFHSPKAPQPNGVLAVNSCFGYHATRWTPWGAACTGQAAQPAEIGKSCMSIAIILYEKPETKPAPSRVIVPAPEQVRPMPPVNR